MLQTLSLFLGIWLLFLLLAIYYLSQAPDGRVGRFRESEPLPDGDVVVMHKLMIEANEEEYLQKANHFAPGIISLRCQHL